MEHVAYMGKKKYTKLGSILKEEECDKLITTMNKSA